MKRWVSGLLIVLMILGCAVGCGRTDEPGKNPTETTASASVTSDSDIGTEPPAETEQPSMQAAENFNCDFHVLCGGTSSANYTNFYDIHAETITGATLNDAVYNRNLLLEEKYGIKIIAIENGSTTTVETAVNAGDNTYACITFGMESAMSLAQRGLLIDTAELINIHTDMPWWNQELQASLTVADRSFVLMGDMNMQQWTQNALVYFNKRIAEENHIDDLYTLVQERKWTLDKLFEYSNRIYSDLNGNSAYDEGDQYGSVFSNFAVPSLLYGAEISYVQRNDDNSLTFAADEKLYMAYEKILAYCQDSTTLYTDAAQYKSRRAEITWDSFIGGRVLFLVEKFDIFTRLQEMDDMYGLLPMPMYDEEQTEYKTWTHYQHGATTAVPVSAFNDAEMVSTVLDDMAYFSMKEIRPAYYETVLQRKLSQDQESSDIVPLIVDGVVYDIGSVVLNINDSIRTAVDDGRSSLVALMVAYQKQMQKKLDDLTEVMAGLE